METSLRVDRVISARERDWLKQHAAEHTALIEREALGDGSTSFVDVNTVRVLYANWPIEKLTIVVGVLDELLRERIAEIREAQASLSAGYEAE